jgi:hypothetical protein
MSSLTKPCLGSPSTSSRPVGPGRQPLPGLPTRSSSCDTPLPRPRHTPEANADAAAPSSKCGGRARRPTPRMASRRARSAMARRRASRPRYAGGARRCELSVPWRECNSRMLTITSSRDGRDVTRKRQERPGPLPPGLHRPDISSQALARLNHPPPPTLPIGWTSTDLKDCDCSKWSRIHDDRQHRTDGVLALPKILDHFDTNPIEDDPPGRPLGLAGWTTAGTPGGGSSAESPKTGRPFAKNTRIFAKQSGFAQCPW